MLFSFTREKSEKNIILLPFSVFTTNRSLNFE